MKKIKLGMIGLSEGNGHPYSWSAIINSYNPTIMAECPFPVIPHYLAKQSFPKDAIEEAEVTHIWTQDKNLSQHIADACYIPSVVNHMEEMIPFIDGVLLARDDAENHIEMATPFLKAGLPIYIDKPIALTCNDVEYLYSLQQYPGQIFTCSAFQYAKELSETGTIKNIYHIEASIKNSWDKYAIHLIEPILKIIGDSIPFQHVDLKKTPEETTVKYNFNNQITVEISTFQHHNVKPTINIFHNQGTTQIIFEDTFFAFKAALQAFVDGIRKSTITTKKGFVLRSIEMLNPSEYSRSH